MEITYWKQKCSCMPSPVEQYDESGKFVEIYCAECDKVYEKISKEEAERDKNKIFILKHTKKEEC